MTELPPSFFKIIRDYRRNDTVSDDAFIAALVASIERGKSERQECGHGTSSIMDDGITCAVCATIKDFKSYYDDPPQSRYDVT